MKKILLTLGLFLGCNSITESEITKSDANALERTRSQIAVVGEVFTATWWGYCPDARAGLLELYENQPHVIPMIWESDGHLSPNYSQRSYLYGVGGIPHVQFNGTVESIGGGTNM